MAWYSMEVLEMQCKTIQRQGKRADHQPGNLPSNFAVYITCVQSTLECSMLLWRTSKSLIQLSFAGKPSASPHRSTEASERIMLLLTRAISVNLRTTRRQLVPKPVAQKDQSGSSLHAVPFVKRPNC
jgi:hypothetical protein